MGNGEIPNWLKGLPLAPEFRPTDTEFADPIAYISKIEKEASAFGICKIIPPLPKPSKKYVLTNLNNSLAKCPELGPDVNSGAKVGSGGGGNDGESRAVFTTRHQELGQSGKRMKGAGSGVQLGVHKQVWQSGEVYTLEQFESKSKVFAKSLLGAVKEVSPLLVEAMFWKAASEKPIYIEYANDVPGSGFGEPEGLLRYFHRRRRKRMHYRRSREDSDCKRNDTDNVVSSRDDDMKDVSTSKDPDTLFEAETPKSSATPLTSPVDEAPSSSRRKRLNTRNEMEGTAGWKLSNSPWNLQVIARSPGSLTRFMPDDIPGVTSPMVYIGMLFSWFAWHVEDHELHSMNFLHTGSPKTWYAVPGDYAFAFEEVIRSEAYGGNVDHLAALALLGEKTTLLSPEVVVASRIPCCRLIQNPGEFVVTFPRAYHIGFSHGFNCGEAANFGTPQWLKVAKEAAVRRAAMNYLPMLSHRQLLYLLTMSFVSRVPRSLLPGARSSRLRDRQKEERELLVKKAFIEDMINENNLLTVLLGKESTYQAVLWDPDLLPSSNQESLSCTVTATITTPPRVKAPHIHSENSYNKNDLFDEMSLYMGTLNDLYLDDYDLSCDFQVDSGTLACVACGILGFPYMSVVQPSVVSSDQILVQEGPGILKSPSAHSSPDLDSATKGNISEDISPVSLSSNDPAIPSITKLKKGWNNSTGFVRPRIFCLEHAVQIEELLRSKGGANVLVICHSDYQKIKAHAAAIAEEIGHPFNYNEIPLDKASQEDLNLIDLAIDDEEHVECGEDWTSKLGINLRHCIKVRKNSPSKQVQHALALGGLFTEKCSSSEFVNIKWQSRKSRSRQKLNRTGHCKPCEGIQMKKDDKKDEVLGRISDGIHVKKEEKIIQYRRRNFKAKPRDLPGTSRDFDLPQKPLLQEVSAATSQNLDEHGKMASEDNFHNVGIGSGSTVETPQLQHEIQVLEATTDISLNSDPADIAVPLLTANSVVGDVEAQIENRNLGEIDVEGRGQNIIMRDGSELLEEINVSEETIEKNEIPCAKESADPNDGNLEMQEENEIIEQTNLVNETCNMVTPNFSEGQHSAEADGDVFMNEVSDPTNPAGSDVLNIVVGSFDGQMKTAVSHSCAKSEVTLTIQPTPASVEDSSEIRSNKDEMILDLVTQTEVNQPMPVSVQDSSGVPAEAEPKEILCSHMALDNEVEQKSKTADGSDEEPVSNSATLIKQPTPITIGECSEVQRESCTAEDLHNGNEGCSSPDNREQESTASTVVDPRSTAAKGRKRRREVEHDIEDKYNWDGFIRSPCEGLRPRAKRDGTSRSEIDGSGRMAKNDKKSIDASVSRKGKKEKTKGTHRCDLEGCCMSFRTKAELQLHKSNRCPHEGCRRRFSSHKYTVLHQRVHDDEKPLKCPWKGCSMSFKWAWARTEHIRLHTGERPYQCKVEGCGLSFRFISDYSRHRRKLGHYVNPST